MLSRLAGCFHFVLALVALLCLPAPIVAQDNPDGSVTIADGHSLRVGGLVQTDAYLAREAGNGFRARSARVRLGGEAPGLSYVIQTELVSSSVLLDALARVPLTNRVTLSGGLFKTPYSAEILKGRANLLFAERARIVNALAPARQVGTTLSAALLPDDRLTATVGTFNGTAGLQSNDNDLLLYVGRLATNVPVGPTELRVGANAAYSIDDDVTVAGREGFSGRRFLVGGDVQLRSAWWLLEGEVHVADLDPDQPGSGTSSPFGYYVAGGADVAPRHQVVARYGYYDADDPAGASDEDNVTLGYNFDVSSTLRAQLNYRAPIEEVGDGFVTARLQVAF